MVEYDLIEPEPEPEPEAEPEPEPEPEPEDIGLSQIKPSSITEENMNPAQKNLFNLMNQHPFEDSPQAPDVDQDMLINLGSVVSKTNIEDQKYNVEYENGTKYQGPIVTNKESPNFEQPMTSGKFQFPNGDEYKGTVGVRASGTYIHSNGIIYKGQFFKLKKTGSGKQTFPDGHEYNGMFKENVYNGKGVMTFSNGDSYKGTFKNGTRHHIGTYTFAEGEVFVGDWEEDMLHGNARCELTNGQKIKSAFQGSSIKV